MRSARDRDALQQAVLDGTIDAVVSDHTPVEPDGKALPFAQAEPGASGLELLLSATLKWRGLDHVNLASGLACVTSRAAQVLSKATRVNLPKGLGQLVVGGVADVCVFDPQAPWSVTPEALRSQGKHTPFAFEVSGMSMSGRVRATLVGGQLAYQGTA